MIERIHFSEVSSTNDYAKEIIKNYNTIAITADFQNAGRGRNKKSWLGDYGKNIFLSLGINAKKNQTFKNISNYQALASIILKKTFDKYFQTKRFIIKYPNDIYAMQGANPKKLSGILIESSYTGSKLDYIIIGIGINCEQEDFKQIEDVEATSLKLLGLDFDKEKLIESLIKEFNIELKENPLSREKQVFYAWASELRLYNKIIRITGYDNKWELKQIFDDGRLELSELGNRTHIKVIDNGDSIRYRLYD